MSPSLSGLGSSFSVTERLQFYRTALKIVRFDITQLERSAIERVAFGSVLGQLMRVAAVASFSRFLATTQNVSDRWLPSDNRTGMADANSLFAAKDAFNRHFFENQVDEIADDYSLRAEFHILEVEILIAVVNAVPNRKQGIFIAVVVLN